MCLIDDIRAYLYLLLLTNFITPSSIYTSIFTCDKSVTGIEIASGPKFSFLAPSNEYSQTWYKLTVLQKTLVLPILVAVNVRTAQNEDSSMGYVVRCIAVHISTQCRCQNMRLGKGLQAVMVF